MIRWTSLLLVLLLGGCVTYPTYTYRDDGYPRDSRYVGDDSYYAPADDDRGDYYYGGASYGYGSSGYRYYAPDYSSSSAYYSLFWPLNRWYHDPYWHPDFYYGVTYFPRNYFSVSFHSSFRSYGSSHWGYGGYRAHYGYNHWYSPYRNSWVDSYYDWDHYDYRNTWRGGYRGHDRYSSALYAPRYGNARNQAERLAWRERSAQPVRGDGISTGLGGRDGRGDYRGQDQSYRYQDQRDSYAPSAYGSQRAPSRGADYGSRSADRQPLNTRGFGVPVERSQSVRGAEIDTYSGRPATTRRGYDTGDTYAPRSAAGRPSISSDSGSYERRMIQHNDSSGEPPAPSLRSRRYEAGSIGDSGSYERRMIQRNDSSGEPSAASLRSRSYDAGSIGDSGSYERRMIQRNDSSGEPPAPSLRSRSYDAGSIGESSSAPVYRSAPVRSETPRYQSREYSSEPSDRFDAPARNYSEPTEASPARSRGAESYERSYSEPEPAARFESYREPEPEPARSSESDSGGYDGGYDSAPVREERDNDRGQSRAREATHFE